MKTKLKTGRLVLDEGAVESLNKILGALVQESSHLRTSPSKVVSLIVSDYEEKFFVKEKNGLVSRLFDKRSYLKHALSSAKTEDELEEIIRNVGTMGLSKKKKRLSRGRDGALESSEKVDIHEG